MKRSLLFFIAAVFISSMGFAQLSGTYNIPSGGTQNYATIAAAINDLNTQGISANVTFLVAPGYTETAPAGGFLLGNSLLNPQSVTYSITFQKDAGTGANPLITAGTGVSPTLDGIWRIQGTDNVTIDGIDLQENAANYDAASVTNTQLWRAEWGYAMLKLSATAPIDGCQNIVIKNCTITMNKDYSFTPPNTGVMTTCTGIYGAPHLATAIGAIDNRNATTDCLNNCKFFNNTISNVTNGIWLIGWTNAPSPYTFYDQNNQIGVDGANTITNFNTYGVIVRQQKSFVVANNLFNSNTFPAGTVFGIFTSNVAGADVYNNTVTIQHTAGLQGITAISVGYIFDPLYTGSIHHNVVQNCLNPNATSQSFIGITSSGVPSTLDFYSNQVINNSIAGTTTGGFTGMVASGQAVNVNMYDNLINNNSKAGTGGTHFGIQAAGTGLVRVYNNTVSKLYVATSVGATGGTLYGISISSGTVVNGNIYKNKVYDLSAGGASGVVNGINVSAALIKVYNNFISDLRTPAATSATKVNAIAGINVAGGTSINAFYNTVYLNASSTGANLYTSAVNASNTPTLDLRNNVLVNVSVPGGGVTAAFRRSAVVAGLPTYSSNSNANCLYSGTATEYYDGTNTYSLVAFQTLVGPARDAGSFRELPPFADVTTTPYDLRMQTTIATNCESGGITISSPISITDDYYGTARAGASDIGAHEFSGIAIGLINPGSVAAAATGSSQVNVSFAANPSNDNVVVVWSTTGVFTTPSGAPPSNLNDPFAGGFLLYNGTTSPANHTGLTGASTYYYKAFSYNTGSSVYSAGVVTFASTSIAVPTAFAATPVGPTQINLAWTKNAFNNDVMIVNNLTGTGFIQPTNGTSYPVGNTALGGTVIYVGPANAYSHTVSAAQANYYKIWSVDLGNNYPYSSTGATANATSFCNAAPIPFSENFESGVIGCGTLVDANNDATTWSVFTGGTQAHSGTKTIRTGTSVYNDWYISQGLQLTGGVTYTFKFWCMTTATTIGPFHSLEVKWGNFPSAAGMSSAPIFYNASMNTGSVYAQFECSSFTPATTGTYYVGLHDFTSTSIFTYLYIDDITVTVANTPATIAWTGASNNDWHLTSNWNPAGIPGTLTDVTVPVVANYPTISSPASCRDITLASGASLLDNGNLTVTGTAMVDRAITGNEWHLISSPVTGATSNMFNGLYLQKHNETTNLFTDITTLTEPLTPMKGFALWNDLTATSQFAGPLNTGTIGTANNVTRNNQGWNLVGNPYASSIDWDAASGWTKTNVDNATYRHVNSASWATYVGGVGTNGGTRYIAPCQGFFVSVANGQTLGTLMMTNAVRTHNTSSFFKSEISDLVRLEVSGNGYTDEAVVRFLEDATTDFDGAYDAYKLNGDVGEAAQLYTVQGNTDYAINSMPKSNSVPVGVHADVNGDYILKATEANGFSELILEDTRNGVFTDLLSGSYGFNLVPGENEQRFILHFKALSVEEPGNANVNIYGYSRDVYVDLSNSREDGNILIYSISGQLVTSVTANRGLNRISLQHGGNYIVKVITSTSTIVKKVYVQ